MTDDEYKKQMLKDRARYACDVILEAEKHKKDRELNKFIKQEMKERQKVLDSAIGSKKPEAKKTKKR